MVQDGEDEMLMCSHGHDGGEGEEPNWDGESETTGHDENPTTEASPHKEWVSPPPPPLPDQWHCSPRRGTESESDMSTSGEESQGTRKARIKRKMACQKDSLVQPHSILPHSMEVIPPSDFTCPGHHGWLTYIGSA